MDELKSLKNLLPKSLQKPENESEACTRTASSTSSKPPVKLNGSARTTLDSVKFQKISPANKKQDMLGSGKLDDLVRRNPSGKHGTVVAVENSAGSKDGILPVIGDGLARLKRESSETLSKNPPEHAEPVLDRVLSKMGKKAFGTSISDDQAVSLPSVHQTGMGMQALAHRMRGGLGSRGRPGSNRGNRNQSLFRNISSAGSAGSREGRFGSAAGGRPFSKNARRVRHDQEVPAFCDPAEILKSCSLFKNCSVAFIRSLQELSGSSAESGKMLEPRTPVVTEGTLGESMFIIERGQCQMTQGSSTRVLGPGDFFGERVLLGLEARHKASVRALTMCQLFEVSCIAFMQTLMRHPIERHQFERGRDQAGKQVQSGSKRSKKRLQTSSDEAAISTASTVTPNVAASSPSSPRSHLASEGGRSSRGGSMPSPKFNVATNRIRASVAASKAQEQRRNDEKSSEASGSTSPRGDKRTTSTAKPSSADKSPSAARSKKYGVNVVDMRGTEAEDESFIERVKRSLKVDVHRGFKMPSTSCLEAYNEHLMEGKAEQSVGRKHHHDDVRIEIGLLPPLSTMTPLQKKGLVRQVEDRLTVRRRLRKAAKRFTTFRMVGFTGAAQALLQERAAAAEKEQSS
mmetsp:Transcript_70788/g.133748  ORF Transcript_70788/g.133748 Transcript_70788/m.133748 type:complete len:630 (-) Transcript_70788:53-1942(-)